MATGPELVSAKSRPSEADSPLTPALKEFIDHAIVPYLVKEALKNPENDLAKEGSDAVHFDRYTAAPETVRP
jgi:hypothetical protein